MRSFRSDNNAGLCPEALEAWGRANEGGHRIGYGDDRLTQEAVAAFRDEFGDDAEVFFVATGTAANCLAIGALTDPWQRVLCHRHSHYNDDESTAPERLTGCRIATANSDPSKLLPADIVELTQNSRGDVHQPAPGVVTISNATEFGTVYNPDEVRELCNRSHSGGFRVHMDGARFANAVASLGCTARELTVDAGLDALSFGGTKNGLAFGEAVLFFPQGDGADFRRAVERFPHLRKGSGHLLSKHRFVSVPLAATLRDGSWLRHASRANEMARRLGDGLTRLGLPPRWSVDANGVFVEMSDELDRGLQELGHGFYPFGDAAWGVRRLMCSFDTTAEEVDGLLGDVKRLIP